MDGLGGEAPQELDPYTRALEEHNRKEPKREIIGRNNKVFFYLGLPPKY